MSIRQVVTLKSSSVVEKEKKVWYITDVYLTERAVTDLVLIPPLAPVDFPLITIQYILLETFVQNLVFLTQPSLHILGNTQTGIFPISRFLVNPL